jgi:hypothetical protein
MAQEDRKRSLPPPASDKPGPQRATPNRVAVQPEVVPEPDRDITARKSRNHRNSTKAFRENKPHASTQTIKVLRFLRDEGPHTGFEISEAIPMMPYTTVSAILSKQKGLRGDVNPPRMRETGENRATCYGRDAAIVEITPAGLELLTQCESATE